MSLNKKALGAGAAVVALSAFVPNPFLMGEAMAQATASDSMKITAKITNPLGVNSGTELDFGTWAVTANNGTFTFDGGGTTINNGVLISTGQLGRVTFTAPKGAGFTISIPDFNGADIFIDTAAGTGGGANSSKTMTVTQIKLTSTTTKFVMGGGANATLTQAGRTETALIKASKTNSTAKASIGGIVNFTNDQNTGVYQGTYTISITF